jgi:hypothetical protein
MSLEGTLVVSEYKANNNNKNGDDDRHHYFAICKACFWTATLLGTKRIVNNNKFNNHDSRSLPVQSVLITKFRSFPWYVLNPFCND